MKLFFGISFLALLLGVSIYPAQLPWDLLPADNGVAGWVRGSGTFYCNTGNPTDSTSLYATMDGGASVYLENGFVAGAFTGYTDNTDRICVEIFDQGNTASARTVYDSTRRSQYEPISNLGDAARLDTNLIFDWVIEFRVSKYFVRLTTIRDDHYKQEAILMGKAIAGNVTALEKPDANAVLAAGLSLSAYPDPAAAGCWFELRGAAPRKNASLKIYDSQGRIVKVMAMEGTKAYWNGTDAIGNALASGRYVAKMNISGRQIQKLVTLQK